MRRAALVLCAVLAACATPGTIPNRPAPGTDAWTLHRTAVAAVERFDVEGRIAIQRGGEGGSAQVRWHQDGPRFELRIIAPLGRGTAVLAGDADQVSLLTPDGARYVSRDVETLMAEHLRWALPVAGARYWVRGVPAPDAPVQGLHTDATGRLRDMEQSGWRVSVLDYTRAADLDLPAKLYLTRGELQLRMVIAQWTPVKP
ncbi:MAG: outer membrane lipoprotein LolB [Gammaproteobacteria bacterium]|nr:outer membrane lipoprotein LolB [Gammaproteobacteria bacterium]MBI5619092.1 outer membrane lipoprotein LolB [Gammaproteobacteria bacterium]